MNILLNIECKGVIIYRIIAFIFFISSTIFSNGMQDWYYSIQKTKKVTFKVETFADGFDVPWGMTFLPDGSLLVSDRSGDLWKVKKDGNSKIKIHGIPKVNSENQGGLLDIEIHPRFNENNLIYLGFSDFLVNQKNKTYTAIIRGVLKNNNLTRQKTIYKAPDSLYALEKHHYGTRIIFSNDGYLFFAIGDRGQREKAQLLNYPNGKIHRLHDDGSIPQDNPFVNNEMALPSIWSYGHRNPQGLVIHPHTGEIWEAEHGPMGGDELNVIFPGNNYGWPVITYGKNYDGSIISYLTQKDGMEQPVLYWTPSIAVCGITFYTGKVFKEWENNLFATSLKYERLHRLEIVDGKVVEQEIIYDAGSRVRDVEIGPLGFVYVALEDPGRIVRFIPVD